ncbi:MAG: lamin tail domain-containing protein [Chloroflexota bacterium]|nr:lamin tail domain-containing protein [Chloroflexota bacterium]
MPRPNHLLSAVAIVAAAALMLTVSQGRATAFSYIENGSFENGTDAWHAGSLELVTVGADDVPPVAGQMSARLSADGGPFTVSQTLFDVPPGTYSVSASVRRTIPDTQIYLRAQAINPEGPGTNDVYSPLTTNQWIQLSGEMTLTAFSQVEVAIKGDGSGAVYIDDVRFDGPPPITATHTSLATVAAIGSSTAVPTSTRTATPTKTASPTHTPTEAAAPLIVGTSLQNGNFELADDSGRPASWDRYGGDLALVSTPVRSGEHAARFESTTDSTKWIYQTVAVEPGGTYVFNAWIRDDDPAVASASLRISWYATDVGSGQALATSDSTGSLDAPAPEYRYLTTVAVLAPDSARSARLRVLLAPASAAPAVIYVDDASFAPAEPALVSATALAVSAGHEDPSVAPAIGSSVASALARSARGASGQAAASGGSAAPPGSRVVINEVLYDPAGTESDASSEWVELYNAGDTTVDLIGWSLADAAASDILPELQIGPHRFAIVSASDSFSKTYPQFAGTVVSVGGRIGNSLGNDGDRLVLHDPSGTVMDAISWGTDTDVLSPAIPDVPAGHSIERRVAGLDSDSAGDFIDNESPSPGGPIGPVSAKPHPKAASDSPVQIVPGTSSSFSRWLPWALASVAATALLVMLSWRAGPALMQRLRTRT